MNKLGIKVYGNDVYEIDGISFRVNSINHENYRKYRMINMNNFGIKLFINRLDE